MFEETEVKDESERKERHSEENISFAGKMVAIAIAVFACNLLVWGIWILTMKAGIKETFLIFVILPLVLQGVILSVVLLIHRKIDRSIQKTAVELAEEKARTVFLSKVSHEIKTPVSAILKMNEMILAEQISPAVESYAMNIRSAGNNLSALIDEVLETTELKAGYIEIEKKEYNLLSVITECYNLVNARAVEKGLELRIVNDASVPSMLIGDEIKIKQIISTILSNAVKYTEDGHVELNIAKEEEDGKTLRVIFTISDTGRGISDEAKAHLFDAFEQNPDITDEDNEGLGLGMSIVKQLIDLMGGSIDIVGEEDVGSVVTISISQAVAESEPVGDISKHIAAINAPVHPQGDKLIAPDLKVLAVDDVKTNLDVFCGLLKRTMIGVDAATSGKDAVKCASDTAYDIIFLDHLMPEMDGVETLKRIREIPGYEKTPIYAVTTNYSDDVEEEYKGYGFDGYIAKPVKKKILEEIIQSYIA